MTPIYERYMAYEERECDAESQALAHKVWDNTPWMINVQMGSHGAERMDRRHLINDYCTQHFGPEAWPIHDKPGNWHLGGAIVDGWQWVGFHTEAMMHQFRTWFTDTFDIPTIHDEAV